MRVNAWHVIAGLLSRAWSSPRCYHHHHHHHLRHEAHRAPPAARAPEGASPASAFLPPPIPSLSSLSSPPSPTLSSGGSAAAVASRCRHRRRGKSWLRPTLAAGCGRRHKPATFASALSGVATLPDSGSESNSSPMMQAGGAGDGGGGGGGVALWLDMRTAALPAAQTLRALYDDLRQREEARGRGPDDPDWSLGRVPNPVGGLLYAAEPVERAEREMEALGGGGGLPCYRLSSVDDGKILDVLSGEIVGVALDPAGDGSGGPERGGNAAVEIVAAAQQGGGGDLVLLRGVRPSVWEGGDMGTVLRIAASTCAGAGKTLVVTARSVGQLHDAAMAAFAASQTQVLGAAGGGGAGGDEDCAPTVVLLIEPMPELWEAGLLYL